VGGLLEGAAVGLGLGGEVAVVAAHVQLGLVEDGLLLAGARRRVVPVVGARVGGVELLQLAASLLAAVGGGPAEGGADAGGDAHGRCYPFRVTAQTTSHGILLR
jgi:hypothetical protein